VIDNKQKGGRKWDDSCERPGVMGTNTGDSVWLMVLLLNTALDAWHMPWDILSVGSN